MIGNFDEENYLNISMEIVLIFCFLLYVMCICSPDQGLFYLILLF